MMNNLKDEYVRDYSFDPEIILGRKDSLSVQRKQYAMRKITKKPRKRKLLIIPQEYMNRKFKWNQNRCDRKNAENDKLSTDEDDDDTLEPPPNQIDSQIEGFYHVSLVMILNRVF